MCRSLIDHAGNNYSDCRTAIIILFFPYKFSFLVLWRRVYLTNTSTITTPMTTRATNASTASTDGATTASLFLGRIGDVLPIEGGGKSTSLEVA